MDSRFDGHPLIRPGKIEPREYQVSIAEQCLKQNTLVVLPTGMGKTIIALLTIVEFAKDGASGKCLFLAPTRVLVHQHRGVLVENTLLRDEEVEVVTGEEPPALRKLRWEKKVLCATPQVVVNDIAEGLLRLEDLSLLIFDEVHRAVGDYAYSIIAERLSTTNPQCRVVGFTASLPGDRQAVQHLVARLRFNRIEARDEDSIEVKPYAHNTDLRWIEVHLPPVLQQIRNLLLEATSPYVKRLVDAGLLPPLATTKQVGFKTLLEVRKKLRPPVHSSTSGALYSLIRIQHALSLLETQSLEAFKNFMDRLSSRRRAVGLAGLMMDPSIREAYEIARGALVLGLEHPKVAVLEEALRQLNAGEKAIVFTGYRYSVEMLHRKLNEKGIKAGYLIGKSQGGLSQDEQVNALEDLKSGKFSVMVATQVGEEGLDVSECNLVVFYDNVPSGVRFIQRRGRTGRRAPGRVLIFITKGTRDEAYYWTGIRRLGQAKGIMRSLVSQGAVNSQQQPLFD